MTEMHTLKAGTILYHGTDCDGFDEAYDQLDGPAWLSSSKAVAHHFASRPGWGGQKRIVTYRLSEKISLHEILSARDMASFADEHEISLCGVEEMRDSVGASGIPGWIIPHNYQEGDDILIADTSVLEFIGSEML